MKVKCTIFFRTDFILVSRERKELESLHFLLNNISIRPDTNRPRCREIVSNKPFISALLHSLPDLFRLLLKCKHPVLMLRIMSGIIFMFSKHWQWWSVRSGPALSNNWIYWRICSWQNVNGDISLSGSTKSRYIASINKGECIVPSIKTFVPFPM